MMDEAMDTEDSSIQFNLSDFPDELLLNLMFYMNDTSLLNMSQTCHRFRDIAKEAFGRIYNGKTFGYFNINILCENNIDDQKRYRPFFCNFGENIQAIEISFDDFQPVHKSHWVYDSMRGYCKPLAKLRINYGDGVDLTKILLQQSSLTHLYMNCNQYLDDFWTLHSFPNLKSFLLSDASSGHQRRNLGNFFDNNRQLTELSIEHNDRNDAFNIIDLLNGKLNDLKLLDVGSGYQLNLPNLESAIVTMDKLESVTLINKYSSYAIVGAMSKGCKNITKLKMWSVSDDIEWDKATSAICSLKTLTTLKINAHNIGALHIQRIIEGLPNLTKLHFYRISYKSTAFESLSNIVPSGGTKLIKLKISVFEDNDYISVNSEFLECMAEFTQHNDSLKVLLKSFRDKLVFTQGEVRRGNSIIYYDKQDKHNKESTLNLLDLLDPCLEKIVGLLDAKSQCALYNSCTKMQSIVKVHISGHVFCTTENIDDITLQSLGQHISRISVDANGFSEDLVLWNNINRYCTTITEIIITGYKLNTNNHAALVWPNVKKIIINCRSKISYQRLRLFVCPMLVYLEVRKFTDNGVQAIDKFDHGDAYRQLTTLKFRCYNEATVKFLLGLDDTICQQIRALSLYNISDSEWKNSSEFCRKQKRSISQLINILIRFRNLTTLKILVPGMSNVDTLYLFENCTKLINLEFCHDMRGDYDIFYHLRANCQQIKFIRVIEPCNIYGYERRQLEKVQKLFPGIKIQIDKTRTF